MISQELYHHIDPIMKYWNLLEYKCHTDFDPEENVLKLDLHFFFLTRQKLALASYSNVSM